MRCLSKTYEYSLWTNIKMYCYNEKHKSYCNVGANGIKVCDRWLESFDNFIKDVGSRPSKEMVFVRKDLTKDYGPDNFQWITNHECRKRNCQHGMVLTPEYTAWRQMKQRCYNIKDKAYKYYGARGISVCEKWKNDFKEFCKDMGLKPNPEYQIERIDNNGNYEPSNCKWATRKEECRNRRSNVILEFNNQKKTLVEWSEIYNISYLVLYKRIFESKWSVEKALTTPVAKRKQNAVERNRK